MFGRIKELRVRLEDEDFKILVAGGEILKLGQDGTPIRMCLADLGFDRMMSHIGDAISEPRTDYTLRK